MAKKFNLECKITDKALIQYQAKLEEISEKVKGKLVMIARTKEGDVGYYITKDTPAHAIKEPQKYYSELTKKALPLMPYFT